MSGAEGSVPEQSGESRGEKRSAPDSTSDLAHQTHSANEWEKAYVGDDDRKNKFLKLMGASKKEHHGRFVIGEKESTKGVKADTTGNLVVGLESQFQQGMEHKRQSGYRGHLGLGFHKETPEDSDTKPSDAEKPADSTESSEASGDSREQSEDSKGTDNSNDSSNSCEKQENKTSEESSSHSATPTSPSKTDKYKTMSFVKSSS